MGIISYGWRSRRYWLQIGRQNIDDDECFLKYYVSVSGNDEGNWVFLFLEHELVMFGD